MENQNPKDDDVIEEIIDVVVEAVNARLEQAAVVVETAVAGAYSSAPMARDIAKASADMVRSFKIAPEAVEVIVKKTKEGQ